MTNPLQSINENFVYNSMLARALVQLLPANDKGVIRLWLDKLHTMDGTPEDLNNRNEYMWFLLLMLQNKKITVPFNRIPPESSLRPLKSILPSEIYEEVLTATDQNMTWLEQASSTSARQDPSQPLPVRNASCRPAQFLETQPMPKDGIICYMAAFSDHS